MSRERPVYVYRLHIEWPPEAYLPNGKPNWKWEPHNWQEVAEEYRCVAYWSGDDPPSLSEPEPLYFKRPEARRSLTRATAERHLKPFLALGCKGWVERSKRVEWE